MSLHDYQFQSEFARKYAEEGYKKAYEMGYQEGFKEGLLLAIERFTKVFGVSLSAEQRETLEKADVERLRAIHEALLSSKQWPAD